MKKLFILAVVFFGCAPAKYPEPKVNCIKSCMSDNTCSLGMVPSNCLDGSPGCIRLLAKDIPNKWEKCEEVCK